jgi:hypothetical protein
MGLESSTTRRPAHSMHCTESTFDLLPRLVVSTLNCMKEGEIILQMMGCLSYSFRSFGHSERGFDETGQRLPGGISLD